ncbi:MAG: RidA family protein [Chloroflexota bacterium]|nr:MAG: RidA family protein [Chloroflexota bacterium]
MPKEVIAPTNVHAARGYAHAYRVVNTIYLAGQVGINPTGQLVGQDDVAVQCDQAYENIKRVLEAAGATMSDVVKITQYFKNIEDLAKIREVRKKHFGDHYPAATAVQVASLAMPDLLIEVEAIAVIDS